MRRTIPVAGAALLAVTALAAGPASAADQALPFQASFSGRSQFTSETTVTLVGTGTATLMGRIATEGDLVVTGPDTSCPGGLANTNVETLTTPDGASLTITSHDVACPTGPGQFHGTGSWEVTGGTGRFAGAAGHGPIEGGSDLVAGTFSMTVTGSVVR